MSTNPEAAPGTETPRRKRVLVLLSVVGGLLFLGLFAVGSWTGIETSIEATSDHEFCGGCHTMDPMVKSYMASIHGGKNDHGIMAKCTDCHLSHKTPVDHLVTKAKTGSHDVWVEFVVGTDDIDWQEKRRHRERFVYDSGCITCHGNLQEATLISNKAFVAHKPYFDGDTDDQCVTCHEHVGHDNISDYLTSNDF
jgi:cytochrome c-type protein NapC